MNKKYLIIGITLLILISSISILFIIFTKDKSTFEEYNRDIIHDIPNLTNKMSLEEIEQEWMEYERNRPTLSSIDKFEWSIVVENIKYNSEIDNLMMIVSNYIDNSNGYERFNEGLKYDFITNEETNFQGHMSWDDTEVYYVLTDVGTLYIRIYDTNR